MVVWDPSRVLCISISALVRAKRGNAHADFNPGSYSGDDSRLSSAEVRDFETLGADLGEVADTWRSDPRNLRQYAKGKRIPGQPAPKLRDHVEYLFPTVAHLEMAKSKRNSEKFYQYRHSTAPNSRTTQVKILTAAEAKQGRDSLNAAQATTDARNASKRKQVHSPAAPTGRPGFKKLAAKPAGAAGNAWANAGKQGSHS